MNVLQRATSESFPVVPDAAPYIVDAFRSLDINGDGMISKDEFAEILSKLAPEVWTLDRIDNLVESMDWNHDGRIQYQEFVRWCCCDEESHMHEPFEHALQMLSGTSYHGLLLHFDAGALPDPQADLEHGARLQGSVPLPADGFESWEATGHRPVFAWELGQEALTEAYRSTRSTGALALETPRVLPSTSFTIGVCLRRWPGNKPITLFQFCCGKSVALDSDGVLFCPHPVRRREASIILPCSEWMMLLFDIFEDKCNVFAAWDVHGFCNMGEINESLGGKTLSSIGAPDPFDWEDDPGRCQIAKFLVWDRALSEIERFQLFTSSAPRFGLVMLTDARGLNSGRPVQRTFLQNQEYERQLKCASAGGEPRGKANFSGLRVNDADLPDIIEAVSRGKVKQLRLVEVQISLAGIEVLLAAFNKESSECQLLLTGCRAVAEVGREVMDRFPDAQISSLEKESCGFESFDVCRFRNLIKTKAKRPAPPPPAERAAPDPVAPVNGESGEPVKPEGPGSPAPEEPEETKTTVKPEEPVAGRCSVGVRLRADPSTKFAKVEALARDTPEVHATSPAKLTAYCKEVADTDVLKAWFLFSWNCYHIDYHCEAYNGKCARLPGDADSVLKQYATHRKRRGMCDAYSQTFHELAELAGLKAKYLSGYARNLSRRPDQDIIADDVGAHGWNAVEIEGKWLLIDSTWGAGGCSDQGFTRSFTPYWFGVPPEEMAFTHFPGEPEWQCLPKPITYKTFISQPIVGLDNFFGRGCAFEECYRPSGTIVLNASNQGSLRLRVPKEITNPHASIGPGLDSQSKSKEGCFLVRRGNTMTVHFRVPRGDQIHTLEFWNSSGDNPFMCACVAKLHVRGPARPEKFIEPYFPKVNWEAVNASKIRFAEELPSGILRCSGTNRASVTVHAPDSTACMPQVESSGSDTSVLLQHEKERVTILATCPRGEHGLSLYAKPNNESASFPFAVGWKISVPPECKTTDRLPRTYSLWNQFRGFLESPLSGNLKEGKQKFRLRFDEKLFGKRKLCVMCGGFPMELKEKNGFFEGEVPVMAPEASIVIKEDLFMKTLVEYQVS